MRAFGIGFLVLGAVALASACGGDAGGNDSTAGASRSQPTQSEAGGVVRHSYGSEPEHFGDLYLPGREGVETGLRPVVVLIHGGFWRAEFSLELMEPLAEDLVARGYGVWNIEYRRVGQPGGGYAGTLEDVPAAIDHIEALARTTGLDADRVAVVGHSAGGHLALWAGQRERIPSGSPGADPAIRVSLAVGQAPVPDLAAAHEQGVGGTAVTDLMGGAPAELPAAYAIASPSELLPIAAEQLIVHGDADRIVPITLSTDYAALAGAEEVTVLGFASADHFHLIDPMHESWGAVVAALAERF